MKAIYAKDIKAMVKKFNLTEDESEYLNDIAEAINKERTEICEEIQMTLLYGSWAQARDNAIRALLVYFGAKAQKENDLPMKLDRTTWEIAKAAMVGQLASPVVEGIDPNPSMPDVCKWSVMFADALINELKKHDNG